eukprot:14618386-Ditylum_brightwellii.AAC.1
MEKKCWCNGAARIVGISQFKEVDGVKELINKHEVDMHVLIATFCNLLLQPQKHIFIAVTGCIVNVTKN